MARERTRTAVKRAERTASGSAPRFQVPFTRKNYIWFGVGIAVLLVGYVCLAQPPVDGFLSKTLAPILLVISYCVIVPYAIMVRDKSAASKPAGD